MEVFALNLVFAFERKYVYFCLISNKSEEDRKCQGLTDRSGVQRSMNVLCNVSQTPPDTTSKHAVLFHNKLSDMRGSRFFCWGGGGVEG